MRNYNQGHGQITLNKSKGFGDTVARVINNHTNIKPKAGCGCKKRQQMLNRIFPYRR